MTAEYRSLLEREVRHLHARFFEGTIAPEVVERYVDAHRRYLPDPDDRARRVMEAILDAQLDPEAVELALRMHRRERFLTRKIQILFYLVEVRSEYYGYFVNSESGRAAAWSSVLKGVVITGFKFIKGTCLVWKHGF